MSVEDLSKALSSGARLRILSALLKGPKDIKSLVRQVGLGRTAVRYHLQTLMRQGLAETREEGGGVGRPRLLYRTAERAVQISFPTRQYMFLSETLVNGMRTSLGDERAKRVLARIVGEASEVLVKDHATRMHVAAWTPELFARHVVMGLLSSFGSQPEVVNASRRGVLFREYNCPFKELALKYPEMICDVMDAAHISGMAKALGRRVKARRLKCAGHNDPYCEYTFQWPR